MSYQQKNALLNRFFDASEAFRSNPTTEGWKKFNALVEELIEYERVHGGISPSEVVVADDARLQQDTSPSQPIEKRVFISYTRSGVRAAELVDRIASEISAKGLAFPYFLQDGDASDPSWVNQVEEHIRAADSVIAVNTLPFAEERLTESAFWAEQQLALRFRRDIFAASARESAPGAYPHAIPLSKENMVSGGMAPLLEMLTEPHSPQSRIHILNSRIYGLTKFEINQKRPNAVRQEIEDLRSQLSYVKTFVRRGDMNGETMKPGEVQSLKSASHHFPTYTVNEPPNGYTEKFQGRIEERRILSDYLNLATNPRLVIITGDAGYGKTALACTVLEGLTATTNRIYISSKDGAGLTLERIYFDTASVLSENDRQSLKTLWQDHHVRISDKVHQLFNTFNHRHAEMLPSIILIDNADADINENGQFQDQDVQFFLETFLSTSLPVKLVITSRRDIYLNTPPEMATSIAVIRLSSMVAPDAVALLRMMDPATILGLQDASPRVLEELVNRSHGNPRVLQAIAAVLSRDPMRTPEDLLRDDPSFGGEWFEHLIGEVQIRLDGDEKKAMNALAVWMTIDDHPVSESAMRFLLQDYLSEENTTPVQFSSVLQRLENSHCLTRLKMPEPAYLLHPLDIERLYSAMSPDERRTWHARSANYVAAILKREKTEPRPLGTTVSLEANYTNVKLKLLQFRHLIAAEQHEDAVAVLEQLTPRYLIRAGFSELLISALTRSQPKDNLKDQVRNLLYIAQASRAIGKFQTAIDTYREALVMARSIDDNLLLGRCYDGIGYVERFREHFEEATLNHEKAIDYAERAGDKLTLASSLISLALVQRATNDLETALETCKEALQATQNDPKLLEQRGFAHEALGRIYRHLVNHEQCINHYEKAIDIAQSGELLDQRGNAYRYSYLSIAQADLGNFERAITFQLRALSISERDTHDLRAQCECMERFANLYTQIGRHDRADFYIQESLALADSLGLNRTKGYCYYHRARMRLVTGSLSDALNDINEAVAIAAESRNSVDNQGWRIFQAQVYLHLGEFEHADQCVEDALKFPTPSNQHRVYLLKAILNTKRNCLEVAQADFLKVIIEAQVLLERTPRFVSALYSMAIAVYGTAVITQRAEDFENAHTVWKNAEAVTNVEGVIKFFRLLRDQIDNPMKDVISNVTF